MGMVFIISKMVVFIVGFGKTTRDMAMECKLNQTELKAKEFGQMVNLLIDT